MQNDARSQARNDLTIALLFLASMNLVVYQITWVYAGPITAISTVALVTYMFRRRGITWSDIGLRRPSKPLVLLGQTLFVFAGTLLMIFLARQVVGLYFEEPATTDSRFGDMEGNLPLYLWWVLLSWIVGGFCEEMLFRGFILTRIEAWLSWGRTSTIIAVIFQATVFGLIHYYYQGAYGALTLFSAACFIGFCYVLFARNFWPLILSHGVMNTIGFLGNYLGDQAF